MRHLIISREYPPAPYHPGGIGGYVEAMARLLAEAGESVHVIGQRWQGAPLAQEQLAGGRLTVHRVALEGESLGDVRDQDAAAALARSVFPPQAFSWQAALLAERLIEREGIDVVEAQEWEGPLYHLLLRRALGLGPAHQPPCVLHFHSPTELIFRHNEWRTDRNDYLPAKRMEEYAIGAADAWLCPSRYLAAQVSARYRLPPDAVTIIPLPMADVPMIPRDPAAWRRGPVTFVGRLEPRKGIVEWTDAAVGAAVRDSELVFEFLGADMPYATGLSVQQYLERRIPSLLHDRFRFLGSRPRAELPAHLARARLVAVPSRWENFPNVCMEAMAAGLPVLVSPDGGMSELVEDGVSGWVAPSSRIEGLGEALARALATPPETLAGMGAAAAARVRSVCDGARIVERQLAFRRAVVERGAGRSRRFSTLLVQGREARTATAAAASGIAVVVAAGDDGAGLQACLECVARQTYPPAYRLLVRDQWAGTAHDAGLERAISEARVAGWQVIGPSTAAVGGGLVAALAQLWRAADATGTLPLGVAFLDAVDRIAPTLVERAQGVLRERPEVGLVSPWARLADGGWHLDPCPAMPYQLMRNGAGPGTIFRAEALRAVGGMRVEVATEFRLWDAANAVVAAGWIGITYPECLVERVPEASPLPRPAGQPRARLQLLERVPEAVEAHAIELMLHLESRAAGAEARALIGDARLDDAATLAEGNATRRLVHALRELHALGGDALRRPGAAVRWVTRMVPRVISRFVSSGRAP